MNTRAIRNWVHPVPPHRPVNCLREEQESHRGLVDSGMSTFLMSGVSVALCGSCLLAQETVVNGPTPAVGGMNNLLPYGHKNFVPTPERPIGFQGDGNGHFPGATLVSEFWEGRPTMGEVELFDGRKKEMLVYADQISKNILWKTELPGWTYAKPIPVKGRLYGVAEPDWVWCADQTTGKILWQERLTLASCEPDLAGRPEEQKKRQEIYDIGRALQFLEIPFRMNKTGKMRSPKMSPQHPFVAQALLFMKSLKDRMQALDADPVIMTAFDEEMECLKTYRDGGLEAVRKMGPPGKHWVGSGDKSWKRAMDIWDREPYGALAHAIGSKYKVALKPLWWGWTPFAVSVPASDGDRIFVCMGQGQVAAYDLDGKRRWCHQHNTSRYPGASHWPSPLVVGDLVLMRKMQYPKNSLGKKMVGLAAYRRDNGTLIWDRQFVDYEGNGTYQSPKHLEVSDPNGKPIDLVVTSSDVVLDARDGSVVADGLVDPRNRTHIGGGGFAVCPVGRGDAFIAGNQKDTLLWRISWDGDKPRVNHDRHFDHLNGPFNGERIQGPAIVLLQDASVVVAGNTTWDADTGHVLGTCRTGNFGNNLCVIGRTVLESDYHKNRMWRGGDGRERKDLSVAHPNKMMEISDPQHPRLRSVWNLIGGSEYPTDLIFQTWLPGVDMAEFWLAQTDSSNWDSGGAFTGLPTWLGGGQCSPLAQGEKTFIQTYKYLYCVRPAVKGTASDAPKVVAGIRIENDGAKLEGYLQHACAQYRYEAALRMKSPSETLKNLAVQDPYEEIRGAAI